MDNPEKLTTLGTQDTGRTKYNTQYRKLKKDEQLSTVSSLMLLFSGTLIISLYRSVFMVITIYNTISTGVCTE